MSAQGELPQLPPLGQPFDMVELRSADGEVLSIDYGHTPPSVERGRSVLLEDLKLQGLKDESAKEEKRPAVQLPALRRTGAGAAVHHQEPDLRLVQQPD